ncbi:uncharacterized protein LOC124915721 [Impatiens glandulifera]|uniref:uncharacterized protein LOC124915721 n=1 Tax=Impatiens glandulifera TaxID=253017 RepID=UPI001FB16163|nr:uncharacterized protein LOC124915721 [Impatiens glandulifera]
MFNNGINDVGMNVEVLAGFARRTRRIRDTNEPNGLISQEEGETSRAVIVEDIVRAMTGISQQHSPTNKFVEFKKLAPPYFNGSSDPLKAEKWIKELEKFFDVLKCDDVERYDLQYFSYKEMQATGGSWRRKLTIVIHVHSHGIHLKKSFYNTYFPKSLRQEKETEFINLKQRNMTITEYQARFVELAKFAQPWMGSEITKARKFEMGLSPHIRQVMVPFEINTFIEVVDKARLVEWELGITRRIDDVNSKKRSIQSANEGNRNSFRNRKPFFASSTTQVT